MTALADTCLDLLKTIHSSSGGNIARRLMGLKILPNNEQSYADVKAALAELRAAGKVTVAGNGKSHSWKAVKP